MQLTAPANYDVTILPQLKAASVVEIYGKLPQDVVGGGRPSYMAAPLSRRRLQNYVQEVHVQGMGFNYLLNSACLGNEEWSAGFQRKLRRLLDWLSELKVDALTVSIPYLAQIIRRHYPHFKIKAGIYAQIDTLKRAQYWEDLGAQAINLESFSMNRDLETLAKIRRGVRADLVLIANHFCQPNCPYQVQHQNGHAHASGNRQKFLVDYPLIQCQKNRLTHPYLFIAAGWIRPEDLRVYEELGYTTFKLLERNIPSEALVARAQAYHDRKFQGNLADLILSWGFKTKPPKFSWTFLLKYFKPWGLRPDKAPLALKFMKSQGMFFPQSQNPISIDTSQIPENFMDRFKQGSCSQQACETCGYCHKIAQKAVKIDPAFLEQVMPLYRTMEDQLVGGGLWGISSQQSLRPPGTEGRDKKPLLKPAGSDS